MSNQASECIYAKKAEVVVSKNSDVTNDAEDGEDGVRSKIFPQILMDILSDENNSDAISWLPHGRAFIIRSRELFEKKVMSKHFSRKSKYSSFTRKLNRWNFVRVSSGPELGAYYHEFFLRDKPQLASQMFCKSPRANLAMLAAGESHQRVAPQQQDQALAEAAAAPVQLPLRQPAAAGLNSAAFCKLAFEDQLLAKRQALEHQEALKKLLMLDAMTVGSCASISPYQTTMSHMIRAELLLQQQSQADRMVQLAELMALRSGKRQSAVKMPTNNRASAA